jgi:DNA replication protein DnaC
MMTRNKTNPMATEAETDLLRSRVQRLRLHGLLAHWNEVAAEPWVAALCAYEENERRRRSEERRLANARIGAFKSMADFEWSWPHKLDRDATEELFSLGFIEEGINVVFLGPNGVGKTMVTRNLAHQAVLHGHTVLFTTASDMLSHLAAQETSGALKRRLRHDCQPRLLCIDEVGDLAYDSRYADLFFEVVTRRYEQQRSIVLSTHRPFSEWPQVFPNAACVVTLVDRLLHRAEVLPIEGSSYRLKEASERAAAKAESRSARRKPSGRTSSTKP